MTKRVAVVTGASRGLGRTIGLKLAESGVNVVLAARSEHHIATLADEINALGAGVGFPVVVDVSDEASVEELFSRTLDEFGGLDILVNNAGVAPEAKLNDITNEHWKYVFDINVLGTMHCARAAGRHFESIGSGRAINIASVFGLVGRAGFTAYGASKGAIINFTRAAAVEWARFGAQMNAVAPGYIATDINSEMRANERVLKKVLSGIPAHRMGEPEEVANLVSYLALDAPDFLTGQTIAIDGGESSI